jgi:hypothetical protein
MGRVSHPGFGNVFVIDGNVFLDGGSVPDGFVYSNGTINGAAMSMSTESSFTLGTIDVDDRQTRDDWRNDRVIAVFDVER